MAKKAVDIVVLNGRIDGAIYVLKKELARQKEKADVLLSLIEEIQTDYTDLANELAKQTKKSKK